MITSSIMQSLNKYKIVYIATICGLLSNAILDIPLMYLFKFIGIKPYLGPLVSSIIGYILSVFINLRAIKKEEKKINYSEAIKTILLILVPALTMMVILVVLRTLLPMATPTRLRAILSIIIYAVVGCIIYLGIAYKMGLLERVFGKELLTKILKKLKLKV